MQVDTNFRSAAAQQPLDDDAAPDSPIKGIRHEPEEPKKAIVPRHFSGPEKQFSHITDRYETKLTDSETFHMRFNHDGGLLAISYFDCSIHIIQSMLGDRMFRIKDDEMTSPITSLTWKPIVNHTENIDSQKLLGACLNGSIIRWTPSMGNSCEHIMLNDQNQYHTIDYAGDRKRFVVAGKQPIIEIYDEERMTKVQQFGDRIDKAHTNKIFTCKFNPEAPNMLYSGGWDRQVRFWDVRANSLVASIGGKTSISGDGVDVSRCNNYVVTGGGTLGEGVMLWDYRNLTEPVRKFIWREVPETGEIINPIVNAVRFIPGQNVILAGCSDDTISAKAFDYNTGGHTDQFNRVAGNCFTLDVTHNGEMACLGDSAGTLHFKNIQYAA